jgi:hypothetical protein
LGSFYTTRVISGPQYVNRPERGNSTADKNPSTRVLVRPDRAVQFSLHEV